MVMTPCSTLMLVQSIAFLANMKNCREILARCVDVHFFSGHVLMRCGNIIQDDWTANGIAVRLFAMIIVYYKLNRKVHRK